MLKWFIFFLIIIFVAVNLACEYDSVGRWTREYNETTNGTWIIEKHFRTLTFFDRTWLFEDQSLRRTEFTPKCEMGTAERKPGWLTVRASTWWKEEGGLIPAYPVCDYTVVVLDPSGREKSYRPLPGTNIVEIPISEKGEHVISFLAADRYRVCEGVFYLDPTKGWSWGCSSGAWLAPWPEEGK